MATDKSLSSMLQKRRLELLKELHAIDILLNADTNAGADGSKPETDRPAKVTTTIYEGGSLGYHSTRDEHIALLKEKTDAITWKAYILKAVEVAGPVTPAAIVDLINDANDHKIPDKRVKDAAASALRELSAEKKIAKQRGKSPEGHLYYAVGDV